MPVQKVWKVIECTSYITNTTYEKNWGWEK